MAIERSELRGAARTIVWGAGALVLAFVLLRPLASYVSVVASGLLLSVAIWAVASAVSRWTHVPYRASVVAVLVAVVAFFTVLFAWMGPLLVEQLSELEDAVLSGVANARAWLENSPMGRDVLTRVQEAIASVGGGGGDVIGGVASGVRKGIGVLTGALVAVALGVFIAFNPRYYVDGGLRLVPPARRARIREVIVKSVHTLRSWLAARLLLMALIGTAFGVALAMLGVPLALPLGVLTAMLAFIPYVGAALSVLPALAVAFVEGPEKALQVFITYLAIQFAESNLLDPIVEARAVRLAPAMVLVAQVVGVVWFGPIAVLYATPLLVVAVVAVRMLYLEDRLGERASDVSTDKSTKRGWHWPKLLRGKRTQSA